MTTKTVQHIIEAVRQANGCLKDENMPCADPFKLSHVAVYMDDETGERVIPAFHYDHFTLNPIEMNFKNEPYITKEHLGGTLNTKGIQIFDLPSIQDRVKLVVEL